MKKLLFWLLLICSTTSSHAQTDETNKTLRDSTILDFVEVPPEYPGGLNALRKELNQKVKFPKSFKAGKWKNMGIKFVVEPDGSIDIVEIVTKIEGCEGCTEEMKRALNDLDHKFTPGKQAGKPVRVWYRVHLRISKLKKK